MADVLVSVPIDESPSERQGWIENISQHIDAGNNVKFVNLANTLTNVEVNRIIINAAITTGWVNFRGKQYEDYESKAWHLSANVLHQINGIHKILAAGTTTGADIHVKVE